MPIYMAPAPRDQPGTEGLNAFFLLVDKPEVYNLPPDPVVPTKKRERRLAVNGRGCGGHGASGARLSPVRWETAMRDLDAPTHITRYQNSVNPVETDGRDIDSSVGSLVGEGSGQFASGASDQHMQSFAPVWRKLPAELPGDATYYERPLLQEPVWEWMISAYYYVGGLTGASLVMSAAAQFSGSEARDSLVKRCRWIAFVGSGISSVLLVADLGRPERFLNMLRVFRPTSPMNMGAWILSGVANGSPGIAARPTPRFIRRARQSQWYFGGHFRRWSRYLHRRSGGQQRCAHLAAIAPLRSDFVWRLGDGQCWFRFQCSSCQRC